MCRKPCRVANPRGVGVAVDSGRGMFEECLQRDGGFHPGQAGAEAGVDAAAEGEMVFGVGAGDVESVGLRENIGVTICTAQQKRDGWCARSCWPPNETSPAVVREVICTGAARRRTSSTALGHRSGS